MDLIFIGGGFTLLIVAIIVIVIAVWAYRKVSNSSTGVVIGEGITDIDDAVACVIIDWLPTKSGRVARKNIITDYIS